MSTHVLMFDYLMRERVIKSSLVYNDFVCSILIALCLWSSFSVSGLLEVLFLSEQFPSFWPVFYKSGTSVTNVNMDILTDSHPKIISSTFFCFIGLYAGERVLWIYASRSDVGGREWDLCVSWKFYGNQKWGFKWSPRRRASLSSTPVPSLSFRIKNTKTSASVVDEGIKCRIHFISSCSRIHKVFKKASLESINL